MNRKAVAQETLSILNQGFYEKNGKKIVIKEKQDASENKSKLITPQQGIEYVHKMRMQKTEFAAIQVKNESAVKTIYDLNKKGKKRIAVLNFASAKNPGGGFINGAMAQEESLAASSGLYASLIKNSTYYETNRACGTMIYTDYAIYSPEVVFFRDERFMLVEEPGTASVLTLPAVNMGQVLLKGENVTLAKQKMKERMRLALAIFAEFEADIIILGAYGCGVFRNNPDEVAKWWKDLLFQEGYGKQFSEIFFSVLDSSQNKKCIQAFENIF